MHKSLIAMLALAVLSACSDGDKVSDDTLDSADPNADGDGDGYAAADDCNDTDPTVNPGADEECDGIDNDCDGEVDDGLAEDWFKDGDGDGFGDPDAVAGSCDYLDGYVPNATDCDDGDDSINPGAYELCDEIDNDCDGEIDEDADGGEIWYQDADGDGYGSTEVTTQACDAPDGYVSDDSDCDDASASTHPDADELCNDLDDDCDTEIDEDPVDPSAWYSDADADDYGDPATLELACDAPAGMVGDGTDCDDGLDVVNPGEDEICDGLDNDCDGDVDDDAIDASTYYADADGDDFGDVDDIANSCELPTGYVEDATDCDDTDDGVYPGADEVCDGIDQDCDGDIDEGATDYQTWYEDGDGDAYGDGDISVYDCTPPSGYVSDGTDCDDDDDTVYPGADEYCDDIDDDCDGTVDNDALDAPTWYRDADSDDYGRTSKTKTQCDQPSGYVADATDCDDTDSGVYPGADEYCDGEDDDCDGTIDEDAIDADTWYADADADAYGDPSSTTAECSAPTGYVADATDCDDDDDDIHPGADEHCDDVDEDCDGTVDDNAVDDTTWYKDADGDDYGKSSKTKDACDQPTGYVALSTDCDDTDSGVYPGAPEYCDGEDDDCDGTIDESAVDATTYYADDDSDAYGDASSTTTSCSAPTGYTSNKTDCDDSDSGVHPGALEYCDGEDDDCDGTIDESPVDAGTWYADDDGDAYGDASSATTSCSAPTGHVSDSTDCDDADDDIHPGADEHCDDVDEDCDGTVDDNAVDDTTWYRDADGDDYGKSSKTLDACDQPTGYVALSTDCDDTDSGVYPGAPEYCDGEDDDCDGTIDESAVDATTYYADDDSDAYGDASSTTTSCSAPTGYTTNKTDCDDTDSGVNPAASEYCDGEDDDCDGTIDESAVDAITYYDDDDGDTYGDKTDTKTSCSTPTGYVTDKTDCDDTDSGVNPAASEYCDGEDDDCDGTIDESAVDAVTYYADSDSDAYGNASASTTSCSKPTGYTTNKTDCDDTDNGVYPGATEYCDGEDDDCDGTIDDSPVDTLTWYADADSDDYGDASSTKSSCAEPSGYTSDSTDCDDGDGTIYPTAYETCDDGIDQDCDGADALCAPTGDWDLSLSDATLYGEANYDYAAASVCTAGDINGDGLDDVVVGAYGTDGAGSYAGSAYVVLGPISGAMDLVYADAELGGETAGDYAGSGVAGAGDSDGDGYGDLLVGARGEDSGGSYAGALYLVLGPISGSASLSTADAKLVGSYANDNVGNAVAALGDVNDDGYDDTFISAYQDDAGGTSSGAGYILLGPYTGRFGLSSADAKLVGEASYDYAGIGLDGAGDTDGDGYDDVIIGAYWEASVASKAGAAYVLGGPVTGTIDLSASDAKLQGSTTSDYAGFSVAGAGDVDGDGYADVLVGAYGYDVGAASEAGIAYLAYGPLSGTSALSSSAASVSGLVAGDRAGYSVSSVGDVDKDGLADVLVGAYKDDTGGADAGAAAFFLGALTGSYTLADGDALLIGEDAGDYAGWDVSPGGDTNGDGYMDFLLGAWKEDTGGSDAGMAYLLYGGVL